MIASQALCLVLVTMTSAIIGPSFLGTSASIDRRFSLHLRRRLRPKADYGYGRTRSQGSGLRYWIPVIVQILASLCKSKMAENFWGQMGRLDVDLPVLQAWYGISILLPNGQYMFLFRQPKPICRR